MHVLVFCLHELHPDTGSSRSYLPSRLAADEARKAADLAGQLTQSQSALSEAAAEREGLQVECDNLRTAVSAPKLQQEPTHAISACSAPELGCKSRHVFHCFRGRYCGEKACCELSLPKRTAYLVLR